MSLVKRKRQYKTRLSDTLSVHSEEHKSRKAERIIDSSYKRFIATAKTYIENQSESTKEQLRKEHDTFLEQTHELKILLQKMENELITELVHYYKEEEKKAIKEIPLEEWEYIVADLNRLAREILEMVSWEKRQEQRAKNGRRPRPEEWHLFRASSAKRRRMMRRSKHARHASEKGKDFIEKMEQQKNYMQVMWRENQRRQWLLKRVISNIKKVDHKFAEELKVKEKEEKAEVKTSLRLFKRKVRNDVHAIEPSHKKMRAWKKMAIAAGIAGASLVGGTKDADAQSFDFGEKVKDRFEKRIEGRITSNEQGIQIQGITKEDGNVIANYYNKGKQREVITIYNHNLEPLWVYLNATQGDNTIDHVYRVFYDRDYGTYELVEIENVKGGIHVNYFMTVKRAFESAMLNPSAKFLNIRKPFDYKMAKVRQGVIQAGQNIGKGFQALGGKYEQRYK